MFRLGAEHSKQLLVLEPLFEEANRCRRTLVQVMRGLDARGIGCAIPDLPGMGESLTDIADASLDSWRSAARTAAEALAGPGRQVRVASFRGAAIFDDSPGLPVWRCAPETGQRVIRDLKRAGLASEAEQDGKLAGHALSLAFVAELENAKPRELSHSIVARLETDAADADVRLVGSPIWRRAEPGEDDALVASLVQHLADWMRDA